MLRRVVFLTGFFLVCTWNFCDYCVALSSETSYLKKHKQQMQRSFYAVLDVDRVVSNSIAYKEFKAKWAKVNDKYQKEIEFYESQLLELEKKATQDKMDKKELIKTKQQIGIYEVKVQKLLRQRKEVLEKAGSKAIEILKENIDKLIYDYAIQNKINIIFSKDQVVYFSPSVDITNFILEKLNSNLRKLEVDI